MLYYWMILATLAVPFASSGLIANIVQLVIAGAICWILWWWLGFLKLPEPFNKVGQVLISFVAVVFLIRFLMGFTV